LLSFREVRFLFAADRQSGDAISSLKVFLLEKVEAGSWLFSHCMTSCFHIDALRFGAYNSHIEDFRFEVPILGQFGIC
jgi:hypothetical protein